MNEQDLRQLALSYATSLDNHGNVKGLLEDAEKIYDWLRGSAGRLEVPGKVTYRGTGTESAGPA